MTRPRRRSARSTIRRPLDDEEPSLREWTLKAIAAILTRWPDSGGVLRLSQKSARVMIETLCASSLEARRNAAIALGCCKVREAASALSGLSAARDMGEVARKAIARISRWRA